MTPERFQQVEELFHAAQGRPHNERAALLAGADPEIRGEVEALLAQVTQTTPQTVATAELASSIQLGPYRIEGALGAGGMGEVFRAMDTRLGRRVAIKVCAEQFTGRFEREARAISALNHPHICTLYDVGPNYLVMELVEGETLAALLKKGALSGDLVIQYGSQLADALAAAHAKGITHRDLKPGNIMIPKSGVKVLDFGLAKSSHDPSLTGSRMVMGTPAYMAPEQLEGLAECDARTDIYALGLVLLEMATGKRLLEGQTPHIAGLSPQLGHVIERCLEKDPSERWQAASDVRKELAWSVKGAIPEQTSTPRSFPWVGVVAAVVGIGILILAMARYWRSDPTPDPIRLNLILANIASEVAGLAVVSPDGKVLVFIARDPAGKQSLWARSLGSSTAQQLPGTDDANYPFWSPDGRWIGFIAQGKLKKVNPKGGAPQTIAAVASIYSAPAWNNSGDIIFAIGNRSSLYRLRESEGVVKPLTRLEESRTENSHREPSFLPDGRHFLFTARTDQRENNALYLGSLDSSQTRVVMTVQSQVQYIQPPNGRTSGELVYMRDGTLERQGFDGAKPTGEPVAIADNVEYNAASVRGSFTVSGDGTVVIFRQGATASGQLTWFDREGTRLGVLGPPGNYIQPRISSDGGRVLFSRPDDQTGNRDVWYIEARRAVAARVTLNPANDWNAIWSNDGRGIMFSSDRAGGSGLHLFTKPSVEPDDSEVAFLGSQDSYSSLSMDWSRDGRWLVFTKNNPVKATPDQIWVAPTSGERSAFPFSQSSFAEKGPRFSPDANWIAYVSNESGRYEVYVRPFNGSKPGGAEKIRISTDGGDFPVWSRDGKELFYMSGDLRIHSVRSSDLLKSSPVPADLFRACDPAQVLPLRGTSYMNPYDVAPDGHFLIDCAISDPGRFEVLLNPGRSNN